MNGLKVSLLIMMIWECEEKYHGGIKMNEEQQDIGIMDVGGTLYFHHDWLKQRIMEVQEYRGAFEQIAFNKNLSIEEMRKLAGHCLEYHKRLEEANKE